MVVFIFHNETWQECKTVPICDLSHLSWSMSWSWSWSGAGQGLIGMDEVVVECQ